MIGPLFYSGKRNTPKFARFWLGTQLGIVHPHCFTRCLGHFYRLFSPYLYGDINVTCD
uniref:Uncharacterized protein n=1 Tax=Rhizophora mucronata TaxID=61149 RepID=A0A2P2QBG4_RHIMU